MGRVWVVCATAALILLVCNEYLYLAHRLAIAAPWSSSCRWPGGDSGDPLRVLLLADLHLIGRRRGHWLDRIWRGMQARGAFAAAAAALKPDVVFVLGDVFDEGKWADASDWAEYVERYHAVVTRALAPSSSAHVVSSFTAELCGADPNTLKVLASCAARTQTRSRCWRAVRRGPKHVQSAAELCGADPNTLKVLALKGFGVDGLFFSTWAHNLVTAASCLVQVGNHDVGDFHPHEEYAEKWSQRVRRFEATLGAANRVVQVRGVSFVLLNTMALTAPDEPPHAQRRAVMDVVARAANESEGTPPIVLLHLPLFRRDDAECHWRDHPVCAPWHDRRTCASEEPYTVGVDVLSEATSRLLLDTLRPSLVLSAHTHQFCERVHQSRAISGATQSTREVTLPTATCRYRDDPGMLLLTVDRPPGGVVRTARCSALRESSVLGLYLATLAVMLTWPLARLSWGLTTRGRSKKTY